MRLTLGTLLLTAALSTAAGCYADDNAQYAGGGGGEEESGDLVEVSPGVEVVADYNEPIFFADDLYWVNRGGYWYSSSWYGGGWGRASYVSPRVTGIVHPEGYAHYRPAGYVGHGQIHGGYQSHAQYHTSHVSSGGTRVRAAVHSSGGRHR